MSVQEELYRSLSNFKCEDSDFETSDIEAVFWAVAPEVRLESDTSLTGLDPAERNNWDHVCECETCWRHLQVLMTVLGIDQDTTALVTAAGRRRRTELCSVSDDLDPESIVEFDAYGVNPEPPQNGRSFIERVGDALSGAWSGWRSGH